MKADRANPLVSVIVCVYNAGPYLRPSLLSLLAQTHRELEILVVDDGSTDGCMETIADLDDSRIRIMRKQNGGKPSAMNLALDQVRGEFYAIHDADDISYPERIAAQVACMSENPDVAAVYCGYELIIDERRVAPVALRMDRRECREEIAAFRMPSHDPTGMYRMSHVGDVRYDPSLRIGEGLDYILRIGEEWPMLVLGRCLYGYRILPDSLTRRDPSERNELVSNVLRKSARRRGLDPVKTFPHIFGPAATPDHMTDNNLVAHFIDSVCCERVQGNRKAALATALSCWRLLPVQRGTYKTLVYAVLPMSTVNRIRSRRRSDGVTADRLTGCRAV